MGEPPKEMLIEALGHGVTDCQVVQEVYLVRTERVDDVGGDVKGMGLPARSERMKVELVRQWPLFPAHTCGMESQ